MQSDSIAGQAATISSLGLVAFDSLRAEDEPWLAWCYVPPADFPLMARWRSALIFGAEGSGKTALRLALEREWCPPGMKPSVLLVRWPLTLALSRELAGTELVMEHVGMVMHVVSRSLLLHLGQHPADWGSASPWAHNTLIWFVQRHFQGDLAHHVASLESQVSEEGLALLRHVATASVTDVLYPAAPTPLILAELVKALQAIGLEGVRITVDGLEPWVATDAERLAAHLEQFLSALALFERPRFTYAMLLPSALESPLWSAGSAARRRADCYSLQWKAEQLRVIVERRLALALGEVDFTLERLGSLEQLIRWLEGCGGRSPRGWLETIRPFLFTYLAESEREGERKPLTEKQCFAVQEWHPPRIFVNLDTGQVTVGWREVTGLQAGQKALLHYLYQHRGQLCRRRDVYRAYLGGTSRELSHKEFAKDYASTLDNAIYRLRQAIEPDPAHPVLVVTVKGEGFRLDNAW
jgi:DNA-binding winged helix-turn-helix (wHTH) protein